LSQTDLFPEPLAVGPAAPLDTEQLEQALGADLVEPQPIPSSSLSKPPGASRKPR